ncbi:hypothetical protein F0L68_18685 [Solihabitans fulvus]|uniref:tRNA synthetase class II core domain (G, H, P, S and T) n=1 Tax=Solihabitans fulvus TaxID=1892852 RepID=A0A5B2XBJ0_9PSEU|nr:hypothetical protein [Solihabitans fulvus]KAA2261088.1 hypothetical protein F0L68_18685 [Solihabitans fulvus]
MSTPDVAAEPDGLTVLHPEAAGLLRLLDGIFEGWGTARGALSMIMPAVLPATQLAHLDVYENFPHQAFLVSTLDLAGDGASAFDAAAGSFPTAALRPAALALPSAACYPVYLHYTGDTIPQDTTVTVLGRCFRNEDHYSELRRIIGFHMREIVAIGSREHVEQHLEHFGELISRFAEALDLPLRREAATDPFFDGDGPRALLQRLAPVKHEFLVGELAISSVNAHRNFFGEKCRISTADGDLAFSSCVAFGLERWLSVLEARFGGWDAAVDAVLTASAEL